MHRKIFQAAKFLIVDDELANVRVIEQLLEQWNCFNVHSTIHPCEAVPLFEQVQPDVVLLDLMMPEMDGFEVMRRLAPLIPEGDYLPILVLTADSTLGTKRRALAAGARDFLTKPFDQAELSLRLWNMIEARHLHLQLHSQNHLLEQRVQERTQQLKEAEFKTLECLAAAAEYRDDDTGQHTQRVGSLSAHLARHAGLPEATVEAIRRAAPLHDVGKIGVSDLILLKPGKLTQEEFATMQQHTTIGASILSRHATPLLELAASIALSHHERWSGGGYPNGLRGEETPIEGRIVAVADVFDALTHARAYKKAWPVPDAIAEIESQSGSHFDPEIVHAFLSLQATRKPDADSEPHAVEEGTDKALTPV